MICFYPGPSKIHASVKQHLADAYDSGVLERNHRSGPFELLLEETNELLKERLNIPNDYVISFVSSATECWEIIAQSFTQRRALHIHNGAFGKKWFEYAKKIKAESTEIAYDINDSILSVKDGIESPEVICITQNDTSNATQVSNSELSSIQSASPESILAIDATSSMAGIDLDFTKGDIWYASVQKCFGLPSGMAVLICSPKASERAESIAENNHYNSFPFILKNTLKNQTTHTPNSLGIFLLNRTMKESSSISDVHQKVAVNSLKWYNFLESHPSFEPLVKNGEVRSNTVVAVKYDKTLISKLLSDAEKAGFVIGKGYGAWKEDSFRIANFPAITDDEIGLLLDFLSKY